MRKCARVILCAVFAIAIDSVGAAQLPLRHYSTADGLPNNEIESIASDSHGFLWFGTDEGLSRFDGYGFSNLTTLNGLPHRVVNQVIVDRRGVYWLATPNGLVRLRPELPASSPDRVAVFHPADSRSQYIHKMIEDRTGRIWCGTTFGVYSVNPNDANPALALVDAGLEGRKPPYGANVWALAEDLEGSVWIGLEDGTLHRRFPDGHVEHYTQAEGIIGKPGRDSINDLLVDRKGRLWIATGWGIYRLIRNPHLGMNVVEYQPKLPITKVSELFEARNGDIWAAMFQWLARFPRDGGPLSLFNNKDGLPEDGSVISIGEDLQGNLWFGTRSGAVKMSAEGIISYSHADGILGNGLMSVSETLGGELYVAANDTGRPINVLHGERFLPVLPIIPSILKPYVFDWRIGRVILQDHVGEWWAVSPFGLLRYPKLEHPAQLARTPPKAFYRKRDGLPHGEVIRLYEDRRGDLWISTSAKAVTVWKRRDERFRSFNFPLRGHASAIGEDGGGNIWVGDEGGQLWRLRDGIFSPVTDSGDGRGWIRDILLDHAGRLWVGTSNKGVLRFDRPTDPYPQFRKYDQTDGLSSAIIPCLAEDSHGFILAGTGNGIDRLDPQTNHVRHYTTADGIAPGETNTAFRDRNGAVWFTTFNGLTRISPDYQQPSRPPAVWITGISIGGQPKPVSELGESAIRGLEILPSQENVQFDFLAPNYASGDVLRYQYRMGSEPWSLPIQSRSVHYGGLAPGFYQFAVRAINADGEVSPTPAVVEFRVIPPVWRRWWFYLLCASILTGAIVWLHRLRVEKLLQVQRMRMRIATDLHDDVGSSLSRIAILSEVAQQQMAHQRRASSAEVGEVLERIGGLAREVIDSTSDIVWAIHPHRDHLSDLKRRMRHFSVDVLSAKNVSTVWNTSDDDSDVELGADLRRQVYLIFKESVNNISRHSRATEAVISLRTDRQDLVLEIRDNGRGFDLAHDGHGNGLKSIRARAVQLGANLELHSDPGGGTSVSLRVPLPE